MLSRILKKDLTRRKGVNLILFVFITIATVFLASSTSNILVVMSAVNDYLDYANVPDITFSTSSLKEQEKIEAWLKEKDKRIKARSFDTIISLNDKSLLIRENGKEKAFDTHRIDMYLGANDSDYCKVFNEEGGSFTLKDGEVAILRSVMENNGLKLGDHIVVKIGTVKKDLTITHYIKDAAFGNDMVGMHRLIVNQNTFEEFASSKEAFVLGMYYIVPDDASAFETELGRAGFTTVVSIITREMFTLVYAFDMIVAALLIAIGICLILVALLVLRFTLVFTLEEDYREIGILKAVGFRDFAIKRIYLIKYLAIVSAGAVLGLLLSFPISSFMIDSVSGNLIVKDGGFYYPVNILCAALIVLLVMLFCYAGTRKLNKVSAITAIRSGHTGERFGKSGGLLLSRRKRLPVPLFLGMNDIIRNKRKYLLLLFTFCISFVLITIPLNTLNTMRSPQMAVKFNLDPKSAVYVSNLENSEDNPVQTLHDLKKKLAKVEQELKKEGYDARLTPVPVFSIQYKSEEESTPKLVFTIQLADGSSHDFIKYDEGTAPTLENEIAFSKKIMEEQGWKIGDHVFAAIGGEEKELIITASYTDYMQIGKSAKLNPEIDMEEEQLLLYWNNMVNMKTDKTQEELKKELSKKLPAYEWSTAQDIIDSNVGGVQDTMDALLFPMTGLLCGVIMLITLLMERLFIVREKGEIAMMKSMGFTNKRIRLWQILRMSCVMLISMLVAVPLSYLSNQFILSPIFAIMGAEIAIQVVPLQVFVIYPGILLAGIITATIIATRSVKKINIRELNNLE